MHLYAPTGTEDALRETNSVFPGFRDRLNKTVYPLVNVGGVCFKENALCFFTETPESLLQMLGLSELSSTQEVLLLNIKFFFN